MCLRNTITEPVDISDQTASPATISHLGVLYAKAYEVICGKQPKVRPWHFQWLSNRKLHAHLFEILPGLEGRVLDVGCGEKPYSAWLDPHKTELVGIDISAKTKADLVVNPNKAWPLEDSSFDAILCTQVLEHVTDADSVLKEIARVLKPSGLIVVTVPFIYNVHGGPSDYRRFSQQGICQLFQKDADILEVRAQGGIGSTIGTLWLNWLETATNKSKLTRLAKGILMPAWILISFATNMGGWLLDQLDRTQSFYGNVLLVARRHD